MRAYDFNEKYFLRDVMGAYMTTLGKEYPNIVIVNADLAATSRNKDFVKTFSNRSFNVGIAEQNMVSFAAGLAHEGFMPFAFSMAPFITMRACEQCRTDVAYGNLNVRLIGTYAGVSGGISGATHWGLEDVAIMSCMGDMIVLEPSDPNQAKKMLEAVTAYQGPVYIRISVEPTISLYDENYEYKLGQATVTKNGTDGTFICSGITVKYALEAAIRIKKKYGKEIRVVDMHTIKPIDQEAIIDAANTGTIVVAQDHVKIGGLGIMVAEVLSENRLNPNFANLGIPDHFVPMAHAPFLYHKFGYDTDGLENTMVMLLGL